MTSMMTYHVIKVDSAKCLGCTHYMKAGIIEPNVVFAPDKERNKVQ